MKAADVNSDDGSSAAHKVVRSTLRWGIWICVALLPLALLSLISFRITARSLEDLDKANNVSADTITAELIRQGSSLFSVG